MSGTAAKSAAGAKCNDTAAKGTAGSNRSKRTASDRAGACKKVLEQKKAREERLSDAEVKLARTEQKEAYAAEQIQQMEAYCETIAGAVKEETATKKRKAFFVKNKRNRGDSGQGSRRGRKAGRAGSGLRKTAG